MKNKFLKSVVIRGVWTFAETMLALIGTLTFVEDISWKAVLSASIMALIISILKSIVTGLPEVEPEIFNNIKDIYENEHVLIPPTSEVEPEYYNIDLPDRKEK